MPSGSPINNSSSATKGNSLATLQDRLKNSKKIYKSSEINNKSRIYDLLQQRGHVKSCDDISTTAVTVPGRKTSVLITDPPASSVQAQCLKMRKESEYTAMHRKKLHSAGESVGIVTHRASYRKQLSADDMKHVLSEQSNKSTLNQSQPWVSNGGGISNAGALKSAVDAVIVVDPERRLAPIGEEARGAASSLYVQLRQQQKVEESQYSLGSVDTVEVQQQKMNENLSGSSTLVTAGTSKPVGITNFNSTIDSVSIKPVAMQANVPNTHLDSASMSHNLTNATVATLQKEHVIRKSSSIALSLNNGKVHFNCSENQISESTHSVNLSSTAARHLSLVDDGSLVSSVSQSVFDSVGRSTDSHVYNSNIIQANTAISAPPIFPNSKYSALDTPVTKSVKNKTYSALNTNSSAPTTESMVKNEPYYTTDGLPSTRTTLGGGLLPNLQSSLQNEAASTTSASTSAVDTNVINTYRSTPASRTISLPATLASKSVTSNGFVSGSGITLPNSRTDTAELSSFETGSISSKAMLEEFERKRIAQKIAERAVKERKIFTVMGPYPTLRDSLRRRGWVEKFAFPDRTPILRNLTCHVPPKSAGSIRDVENKPPMDMNMCTMLSNIVRNVTPTLLFAVRGVDVSPKVTKPTQVVNHFARASNFTTKVGLCRNLKSLPWYYSIDPSTFYPRCYSIDSAIEKTAFIDDYKLMACMGFLKHFLAQEALTSPGSLDILESTGVNNNNRPKLSKRIRSEADTVLHKNSTNTVLTEVQNLSNVQSNRTYKSYFKNSLSNLSTNLNQLQPHPDHSASSSLAAGDSGRAHILNGEQINNKQLSAFDDSMKVPDSIASDLTSQRAELSNKTVIDADVRTKNTDGVKDSVANNSNKKKGKWLSVKALYLAMKQCTAYLLQQKHDDLDKLDDKERLSDDVWNQFIYAYHQFVSDELPLDRKGLKELPACKKLVEDMEKVWPQFNMDGDRNVWIIKPAAKSRGRGIKCDSQLNTILEASKTSDCPLVAQKYIERPLLIYNTKFDIRQWFLVTDWNPLTMWFYKDCYLRFCSHEYSLDSFDPSIHLSNYSVQKYYKPSADRSINLPNDNMWTSQEFIEYLSLQGCDGVWKEKIIPGMKQAIICTLLCTQEHVEHRKGSFELFGADFMLTEDLHPWLLEINSSPSMARDTRATSLLVSAVLEDTVKVVLDRRDDPTCDIGRFELAYCQPHRYAEPKSLESLPKLSGKRVTGRKISSKIT